MVDFSQLKKNRGTASLDALNKKLASVNSNESRGKDERFWSPGTDDQGNGYAVFRLLPAPAGEDDPFVRVFDHGFQGPGGWYIENSLTTIGKEDPVSKHNSELWNSGIDANKDVARKQKRRLHFISNIYVIKDSANPANEGKVFLYKYGKKIFEKFTDVMNPKFEDETPINPFDLWEGANFKLKIRQVEGYRNYDKSEFDKQSVLGGFDDEKLEQIYKSEHSLAAFLDESNFKSYDELQKRLNKVLGLNEPAASKEPVAEARQSREKAAPMEESKKVDDNPWSSSSSTDDDDDLEFFKKLASE